MRRPLRWTGRATSNLPTDQRLSILVGQTPGNGRLGEQWDVELFARNLFDEEALITATSNTALVRRQPTGYANQWPIPGQRFGLIASYRW